jgi:hypothetical protein
MIYDGIATKENDEVVLMSQAMSSVNLCSCSRLDMLWIFPYFHKFMYVLGLFHGIAKAYRQKS